MGWGAEEEGRELGVWWGWTGRRFSAARCGVGCRRALCPAVQGQAWRVGSVAFKSLLLKIHFFSEVDVARSGMGRLGLMSSAGWVSQVAHTGNAVTTQTGSGLLRAPRGLACPGSSRERGSLYFGVWLLSLAGTLEGLTGSVVVGAAFLPSFPLRGGLCLPSVDVWALPRL